MSKITVHCSSNLIKKLFYSFLSPLLFKKKKKFSLSLFLLFSLFLPWPCVSLFFLSSFSSLLLQIFPTSSSFLLLLLLLLLFFFFLNFLSYGRKYLFLFLLFFFFLSIFFLSFVVVMGFIACCGCGGNRFYGQLWVLLWWVCWFGCGYGGDGFVGLVLVVGVVVMVFVGFDCVFYVVVVVVGCGCDGFFFFFLWW